MSKTKKSGGGFFSGIGEALSELIDAIFDILT